METCTVETGLLRKKPCGKASVTHCANCEQPLCKDHAVRHAGKFMCKECHEARRDFEKNVGDAPPKSAAPAAAEKKPAAPEKKPAAPEAKPAAPAAAKPAATPAKPAPAAKPEAPKPDDDAPLEFTPSDKTKK
jgi:hypothetical protein